MIITKTEAAERKPVIDLTGPQGNVMFFLATYDAALKKGGVTKSQRREAIKMWVKDCRYEDLVKKFIHLVGDKADFIIPDELNIYP